MQADFKLDGFVDLNAQLIALKDDVAAGKALRSAAMAGARVIANETRDQAPEGPSGNMKKSIRLRSFVGQGGVAVSAGTIISRGAAPHWHLIEFGTQQRKTKGGRNTGTVMANPFFRRSFDAKKDAALEKLKQTLQRRIKTVLAKRKAGRA